MFYIPGGDDFRSSFRHHGAGRGYCYDDSIPHNNICANGLRPTSGYFILQIRLLEEYHLFGTILILITWECPIIALAQYSIAIVKARK